MSVLFSHIIDSNVTTDVCLWRFSIFIWFMRWSSACQCRAEDLSLPQLLNWQALIDRLTSQIFTVMNALILRNKTSSFSSVDSIFIFLAHKLDRPEKHERRYAKFVFCPVKFPSTRAAVGWDMSVVRGHNNTSLNTVTVKGPCIYLVVVYEIRGFVLHFPMLYRT